MPIVNNRQAISTTVRLDVYVPRTISLHIMSNRFYHIMLRDTAAATNNSAAMDMDTDTPAAPPTPPQKGAMPILSHRDRFHVDLIDMRTRGKKNIRGLKMRRIMIVIDHSTGQISTHS